MEKELTVRIYISRHNLVSDEMFNATKDALLNEGVEVTYYERGQTYTTAPIIEADAMLVMPWWDQELYKLGRGTRQELQVASTHSKIIMMYCTPDKKYRILSELTDIPSEDWKHVSNAVPAEEVINLKTYIAKLDEELQKTGRKEIDDKEMII